MDKNSLLACAYILTSAHVDEFCTLFPQVHGFREAALARDSLLSHLDLTSAPLEQKLFLAGSLAAYSLTVKETEVLNRLNSLFTKAEISQRFFHRITSLISRPHLVNAPLSSPLHLITHPSQFRTELAKLVRSSLAEGDYQRLIPIVGLKSQEFEHSLDRTMLNMLHKTKGLDLIIRAASKYSLDRLLMIYCVGGALRIGPRQLPDVHGMYLEANLALDMNEVPPAYVEQNGNIYTTSTGAQNPVVVFSSECLDRLNYSEQLFFAGRELGHIKSNHNVYAVVREIVLNDELLKDVVGSIPFLGAVTGPVVMGLKSALTMWQWASEYTADRAGLLSCQNIDTALSALMKTSGAPERYYAQISVEEFKAQAEEFDHLSASLRDRAYKAIMAALKGKSNGKSEPWTVTRAYELLKWYQSGEYQRILERIPVNQTDVPDQNGESSSWLDGVKSKIGTLISDEVKNGGDYDSLTD